MTQKHTPEPWSLSLAQNAAGVITGGPVRELHNGTSVQGQIASACLQEWISSGERDANTRRIVACVNALAGIGDDNALFFHGNRVRSVISSMKLKELDLEQQRDHLQAEVDELLKAAENLLSNVVFVNFSGEWNTSFVEDADLTEYCQPLQDVINKITGETK